MDNSNFKFELLKHFINKKMIQESFQLKNIQTIQKAPQIMSDIDGKPKNIEEKLIYEVMEQELREEFQDFRYKARGAQGYVVLAKKKQTNKRFAIKGYCVRHEVGKEEQEQLLKDAKNEIDILSQCSGSPYVSNLIKPIDIEKNRFLYLVLTEQQGTLQEVIDSTQDKRLNETSTIKYSKDISEGLLHIHNKGYLVNDLKMDNILIDYCGNAVVSDFGYAQKLKKNNGYAYSEYEGNLYFQAPECVDRKTEKLYENEYKKLRVETQMNPSERSEACSLGYLIYTMVQGKKSYKFIYEKHKPLEYDNNFKSFKYSQKLQFIIDGLTKFIPRDRISVKEAFDLLKEIYDIEFNLNYKFQIFVSEQTQIFSQNQLKGIEFIENFDKKYYPIVQNEDSLLKELLSENNSSNELLEKLKQLENENKYLLEDKEKFQKILKEKENQISELQAVSLKNTQEKEKEIIDLKTKVETQNIEVVKLQILNSSLQQKQDVLLINNQKKDQDILQIQNQLQNLENQNKCFLENQDKAQQEIQHLKEKIKENQEKAQKKVQELEEKIKLNSLSKQGDIRKIQIQQFDMKLKEDYFPQQMKLQESQQQQYMNVQGSQNQQLKTTEQLNYCQCKINGKCQKKCAKQECGHKFCGTSVCSEYRPKWGNEGCCRCEKTDQGTTCSFGCKRDYCKRKW